MARCSSCFAAFGHACINSCSLAVLPFCISFSSNVIKAKQCCFVRICKQGSRYLHGSPEYHKLHGLRQLAKPPQAPAPRLSGACCCRIAQTVQKCAYTTRILGHNLRTCVGGSTSFILTINSLWVCRADAHSAVGPSVGVVRAAVIEF